MVVAACHTTMTNHVVSTMEREGERVRMVEGLYAMYTKLAPSWRRRRLACAFLLFEAGQSGGTEGARWKCATP